MEEDADRILSIRIKVDSSCSYEEEWVSAGKEHRFPTRIAPDAASRYFFFRFLMHSGIVFCNYCRCAYEKWWLGVRLH